ncbi:hypothetical protein [Zhengella mangrovi]|uniref:hypothetical protein n=1 Tax=Zhengella mangrovi TaxID=1982044 RepID=UPI0013FE36E6|nr:hypothetical protein [Zhengella mangrovi]
MFPKNLRTRLRPLKVWVWAIVAPRLALANLAEFFRSWQNGIPQTVKTRLLNARTGPSGKGFWQLAAVSPHVPLAGGGTGGQVSLPARHLENQVIT